MVRCLGDMSTPIYRLSIDNLPLRYRENTAASALMDRQVLPIWPLSHIFSLLVVPLRVGSEDESKCVLRPLFAVLSKWFRIFMSPC
jgi:hypothetical protein